MRTVKERGVCFVRLWFVDVLGMLKSLAIPVSELEIALAEGVGIDGSSLEGTTRLRERDAIARPDPATFQVLPWRPGSLIARMFCDIELPDGSPYPSDSRHALRRTLDQAAALGYSFLVGPEIEFFLFEATTEKGGEPKPLDDGAYFDLTTFDGGSDFRRRAIEYVEQMGIPVKASHHELSASQHEIDLLHTDALSMADGITTFRICVKEVARQLGLHATFMPKPSNRLAGSGMHLHLSVSDGDRNVFHSDDPFEPLSPVGSAFLAGVLAHAPELTAVTNQWVNSYKRLGDFEAPRRVDWARQGTDSLVRVPSNRPDRETATRIEMRSPDGACNPYLVFALLLAAGLQGIERGYQLAAESSGEQRLPEDLREAVDLFEGSQLARDTLGEVMCDCILRNKRAQWHEAQRTVTELERQTLLPLL